MRRPVQLRVFAGPLVLLAITSVSLAAVMQFSDERFYMYMMFLGIISAHIDLAVGWLVFGGGSYWVRMPLIVIMSLAASYLMSYTFPQSADVWLGNLLVRIPLVGLPLVILRFRGAELVHVNDPPTKKHVTFQFSLASLLTLFTTTAIYLFAGRFAVFPREAVISLILYSSSCFVSLAAMAAAWARRATALRIFAVMLSGALLAVLPERLDGPGYIPFAMMLGALLVSIMTPIMLLRIMGYSIGHSARGEVATSAG